MQVQKTPASDRSSVLWAVRSAERQQPCSGTCIIVHHYVPRGLASCWSTSKPGQTPVSVLKVAWRCKRVIQNDLLVMWLVSAVRPCGKWSSTSPNQPDTLHCSSFHTNLSPSILCLIHFLPFVTYTHTHTHTHTAMLHSIVFHLTLHREMERKKIEKESPPLSLSLWHTHTHIFALLSLGRLSYPAPNPPRLPPELCTWLWPWLRLSPKPISNHTLKTRS